MVGVGEVRGRELGWGAEIWPQGDNLGSRLKEAEVPFICTGTKGLLYVCPYCVNTTCLVRSSRKTFLVMRAELTSFWNMSMTPQSGSGCHGCPTC